MQVWINTTLYIYYLSFIHRTQVVNRLNKSLRLTWVKIILKIFYIYINLGKARNYSLREKNYKIYIIKRRQI